LETIKNEERIVLKNNEKRKRKEKEIKKERKTKKEKRAILKKRVSKIVS